MKNKIINLQNSDAWKIQLTIAINIISSTESDKECVMHWSSDKIRFATYSEVIDVIKKLLKSLRAKYQNGLGTSMKGSDFILDSVKLMYYKCHKVNFKCVGSYIDSQDWIKKRKATIIPRNKDDECFQYAASVALNYQAIKWNPERVSHIKSFVNKYNWKGMNYPSKIDDCKTFETMALNILYIKEKEILLAYIKTY